MESATTDNQTTVCRWPTLLKYPEIVAVTLQRLANHHTLDECCGLAQRLVPDDGKGKGKMDIQIDATLRDQRGYSDPDFWKHTDGTRQFQQARCVTLCACEM